LSDVVETLQRNPDLIAIVGDLLIDDLVRALRLVPHYVSAIFEMLSPGFSELHTLPSAQP
jgi:hypothetical protein